MERGNARCVFDPQFLEDASAGGTRLLWRGVVSSESVVAPLLSVGDSEGVDKNELNYYYLSDAARVPVSTFT